MPLANQAVFDVAGEITAKLQELGQLPYEVLVGAGVGEESGFQAVEYNAKCKYRFAADGSSEETGVHLYTMLVEWDPGKARLNARKHGVALADAVAVLEDETALTMRDPFAEDEERWITLGLDAFGRALVVVYTWRGECVRLI